MIIIFLFKTIENSQKLTLLFSFPRLLFCKAKSSPSFSTLPDKL